MDPYILILWTTNVNAKCYYLVPFLLFNKEQREKLYRCHGVYWHSGQDNTVRWLDVQLFPDQATAEDYARLVDDPPTQDLSSYEVESDFTEGIVIPSSIQIDRIIEAGVL